MNRNFMFGAGQHESAAPHSTSVPEEGAANNQHRDGQPTVRLMFNERPFYDPWLLKTHPSKVYFETYQLVPVPGGFVPMMISCVLVDKAIVN